MHRLRHSQYRLPPALLCLTLGCLAAPTHLTAQNKGTIQPDSLRRAIIAEMKQGLRDMLGAEAWSTRAA